MRSASGPAPGHDDPSPVATLTLPASTQSVPVARRFVTDALTDLGAAGACDDAVALVCGLAKNAVVPRRRRGTGVRARHERGDPRPHLLHDYREPRWGRRSRRRP